MVEAKVRDIQIQPLKSGGSLTLEEARMNLSGLETLNGRIKDHFLVAVSGEKDGVGDYNFFTQRIQVDQNKGLLVSGTPELALVKPRVEGEKLFFDFKGDPVAVPDMEDDDLSRTLPVQVWEHRGLAVEIPTLSEWLSDSLGRNVKVARTNGPWNRMSRQNFQKNENPLRAQEGYPIHAVTWEDVVAMFGAIDAKADP
ncbi:MAG: hypothetical protein ACMG6E_07245, partial [Candidatus Roizmanbacteria bacterium]